MKTPEWLVPEGRSLEHHPVTSPPTNQKKVTYPVELPANFAYKTFPWKSSGSLGLLNMCACVLTHFSRVRLCDAMKCSLPAPLPIGFSRQECCSGLPCPSLGELPHLEIEFSSLMFPALAGESFTTSHLGSPLKMNITSSLLNFGIKLSLLQIATFLNNT